MSGICGITFPSNKDISNNELLHEIHKWNLPYGSSCSDIFTHQNVSLGCHLEHITNAPIPSNPILSGNQKIAVIDAVIYNREELLSVCSDATSLSDEELLFNYIITYGYDALSKVNGDFAGIIYDANTHTVTLFRDHIGIRPLYYSFDETLLVFSTDMRGILAFPPIQPTLNEDWLYKKISGHSLLNTEDTEFSNIRCVPPSGYITFSCNSKITLVEKKKYWSFSKQKLHLPTTEDYATELRKLITDSVNRRLSVYPGVIGAELSGGLDSGIIDILINRAGRNAVYHSWSIDPDLLPYVKEDERLVIADICKQEKITCHYSGFPTDMDTALGINSNIAKNTASIKGKILATDSLPEEFALPPHINTLSICQTAEFFNRAGVRVVFSGHGGDEGVSHRANPYELFYHHEYYHFLKQMYRLSYRKKHRIMHTLKDIYTSVFVTGKNLKKPFVMFTATPEIFQSSFRDKMKKLPAPASYFSYDPKKYVLNGGSRNRLDVVALLGALGGARYVIPYLDYRTIDFALSIPRHLYLKGHVNRYIFREAFKSLIPTSLYQLTIKSENSRASLEPPKDIYERFSQKKKHIYDNLNRDFWENYLDFEKITEWFHRDTSSSEEQHTKDEMIMCNLNECLDYQNMLIQVRGEL